MTLPTILILAAGLSSRMRGQDKLLLPVDGVAQLRRITQAALATGCRVLVTLPPEGPHRRDCLVGLAVEVVEVTDGRDGMAASIRTGARAVDAGAGLMVVPADMPALERSDLEAVIAAHQLAPDAILRASAQDQPGHPVIIPQDLVADLQEITGDVGARGLIRRHADRLKLVPLPGENATLDLDTPEAWAAWLDRTDRGRATGAAI